jgi:arylsulfatase A-like enzyme
MRRALCLAAMLAWTLATAVHAAPLNVVLILADDLGAHDLGCTGSRFHRTPRLDSLAAEGMRFTQAYSACTVCSPTRAAVLTGKYPARLHLTDWIKGHPYTTAKLRPPEWTQSLPLEEQTLAERLRAHGYRTAHIGKWHLGSDGFSPEDHGFGLNLGGDHRGQPPSYFAPYRLPRLTDGPPGEYLTDREGEEAARWIAAHASEPFFLYYCPHAVHTPLQAPETLQREYSNRRSGVTGSQTNATYAAMLDRLDAAVGKILDALAQHSLTDRTLVIFTSDNGGLVLGRNPPTSNEPLRAGKGSPYEGGHRVPLLIKWPGVTRAGSTSAVPVASIDLFPTLLEALTVPDEAPARIDGLSLVPMLRDPTATLGREALFWHYPHYHPGGATPYAAVRAGAWKLIQYYETGRHELFNLIEDPGETMDLASAQPEQVLTLSRTLFDWQNRVRAQSPRHNPDWKPEPIEPQPDGSIRLHARDAFVHGEVLRYEPQPFKNTLGWWTRKEDWASWDLTIPKAATYRVEIMQGCGNGSGGSNVEFTIGTAKLVTSILETGGFQSFTNRTIGTVELPPGPLTLAVRPLAKPGPAVMDLREIILRPVN